LGPGQDSTEIIITSISQARRFNVISLNRRNLLPTRSERLIPHGIVAHYNPPQSYILI